MVRARKGFTGAGENLEQNEAEALYGLIRRLQKDTKPISRRTGIPLHVVESVRRHLFLEKHTIPESPYKRRYGYFIADAEIGELWLRAAGSGNLSADELDVFIQIIAHEYVEHCLMRVGFEFRSSDPRAWEYEGGVWASRATPEAYGAHDLSFSLRNPDDPYAHWKTALKIGV